MAPALCAQVVFTFFTVVVVLDTTYGARLPETFTDWTGAFNIVNLDLTGVMLPQACIQLGAAASGFLGTLIINSVIPLVLVVLACIFCVCKRLARPSASHCGAMMEGLLATLPLGLLISFCFVASTSATVFQAFSCIGYKYDANTYHSFLRADLSVRCSDADHVSKEHGAIRAVAWVFVAVWPIGTVFIYLALLLLCRKAILSRTPTRLSRAIRFLTHDYTPECFYWEVLELVRRTALVGWVLLVPVEQSFIRLIIALLISVVFLIALLTMLPYQKVEDNVIAAAAQASCIFIFIGAILTRLYGEFSDVSQDGVVTNIMAFDSTEAIAMPLILVTFGILILMAGTMVLLLRKHKSLPHVKLVATLHYPELDFPDACKWHLFLRLVALRWRLPLQSSCDLSSLCSCVRVGGASNSALQ